MSIALDKNGKKVYNFNITIGGMLMTEYLTNYMKTVLKRLEECSSGAELEEILSEHKDKIAFMQHERIVHFLVTMMFAVVLAVFMGIVMFTENPAMLLLVTIIIVLLGFYIKHYYFLENTVQKMYRVYDDILAKRRTLAAGEDIRND
jgi:fatty acid desaturase